MKIRTTERSHNFRTDFFNKFNIHQLEGLTLDSDYNFTACVEAIEFSPHENINIKDIFTKDEINAKMIIADTLNIPFYIIAERNWEFYIWQVQKEQQFKPLYKLNNLQFVKWWANIKRTPQPKRLYEARERANKSRFDNLLEANGLAWGGNLDGFIVKENKVAAIIENIFTKYDLTSKYADPYLYFKSKGPNYNSWLPTVKLARFFNVPLFLFTYEANTNNERVGFTVIDSLSKESIEYRNKVHPWGNVIEGMGNIIQSAEKRLNEAPPELS